MIRVRPRPAEQHPLVLRALEQLDGRIVDPAAVISEKDQSVVRRYRLAKSRLEARLKHERGERVWPRQGASVQLVRVDDAGHVVYRIHDAASRPVTGLFESTEAATAYADEYGWKVAP